MLITLMQKLHKNKKKFIQMGPHGLLETELLQQNFVKPYHKNGIAKWEMCNNLSLLKVHKLLK